LAGPGIARLGGCVIETLLSLAHRNAPRAR
jgi:hypothetical protein